MHITIADRKGRRIDPATITEMSQLEIKLGMSLQSKGREPKVDRLKIGDFYKTLSTAFEILESTKKFLPP